MHSSEPFPHLVDDYLGYLYEVLPTGASLDGVHLHDDLFEDLARPALDGHLRALAGFARRLNQLDPASLSPTERVDHAIVSANVDARMFDLETVRRWDRDPQAYAEVIGAGLAAQAMFDHAPEVDRARRVASKLRQVPRLVQCARDNVKECPGLFVKTSLEAWRGVLRFIESDLPRAFSSLDDLHILADLADTSSEAAASVTSYLAYLEGDMAPRAKASFRLGKDTLEQQFRRHEGITLGTERILSIAIRELNELQEEFRSVAGRLNGGDPIAAWRKAKEQHAPPPGQLVAAAKAQLDEISTFLRRQNIVSVPAGSAVIVAPSPGFDRWTSASMWASGPFETKPGPAYYCLTDVDPTWPAERQEEHRRDLSAASLWSMTIHEVYPGHLLHWQHLRSVDSKVRKSLLLASGAFVEGWAHYSEQVMVEAGFRRSDATFKLGQLSEALVRIARLIVGIRLHCDDLSVEQGMRFFRDEAFLEEHTARREAERGAFDATVPLYAAGRLMMLKLRSDYREQEESRFSLRTFHDAVLAQGNAPFWAHRRLLMDDSSDALLE